MNASRVRAVLAGTAAVLVLVGGGAVWSSTRYQTPLTQHLPADLRPRTFPAVDPPSSPARAAIIDHLRAEFSANRPGTYYSEGVTEPWCADFVSTVLRDAGAALRNPVSGSWRIPGVATLTDYFRSTDRLRPASYRPVPGDVVLYAPPNELGQHTNIVVAVRGDAVTTVGGNQAGGVSALSFDLGDAAGVVGYGVPV